jgi:hypothetical protein
VLIVGARLEGQRLAHVADALRVSQRVPRPRDGVAEPLAPFGAQLRDHRVAVAVGLDYRRPSAT